MSVRCLWAGAVLAVIMAVAVPRVEPQKRPPRQPGAAAEQDREGIEKLQNREIAATMGFNVDELLLLWTDDAVLLPPRHDPIVGKAALRKYLEAKKDEYANFDILGYNEEWNEVMVIGDYAYQWGTISFRMKPATGDEVATKVHAMRVLHRGAEGAWRVARAMWNAAPQ